MAKDIASTIMSFLPLIIIGVILLVFSSKIKEFYNDITKSQAQKDLETANKVEEKRVKENGLFDNIVEFFFGKPEEAKPTKTSDVSKNDFDQNTQTQTERAKQTQSRNDTVFVDSSKTQNVVDTRTQAQRNKQLADLIAQSKAHLNPATVVRPQNTVVLQKAPTPQKTTQSFGVSAGGLVSQFLINASKTSTPSATISKSGSSSKNPTVFSSAKVSDKITATVIKGQPLTKVEQQAVNRNKSVFRK